MLQLTISVCSLPVAMQDFLFSLWIQLDFIQSLFLDVFSMFVKAFATLNVLVFEGTTAPGENVNLLMVSPSSPHLKIYTWSLKVFWTLFYGKIGKILKASYKQKRYGRNTVAPHPQYTHIHACTHMLTVLFDSFQEIRKDFRIKGRRGTWVAQ